MIRFVSCAALVLGGAVGVAVPAQAASFDCSKAATPFENAICDNPELSAEDDRLALTYQIASAALSDEASAQLRTSQREWLGYAQRACTDDAEPLTAGSYDEDGVRCLTSTFSSRSRVLEQSRMMDGLRFFPVSQYQARPDTYEQDNPDTSWPVATHELSVIQLDSDVPYAEVFNALVEEEGEKLSGVFSAQGGPEVVQDSETTDSANSISVKDISGDNRITLEANGYWYGHGAAHGNYTITYLHFLPGEERWLEASDIFTGKGWQRALLDLVVEAANAEHGDMLMLDDPSYIADSVIDPTRWDLSDPYGLVIQFQPYELAAYAYGAPTARVSWEALEPYLAEGSYTYR